MKKRIVLYVLLVIALFVVVSCTAGPNEMLKTPDLEGETAGFFMGLWHGFTLLFSFIVSLFNDKVNVYEVHNVGPLYNLGYLLGVSCFFSGSGHAGGKSRRKR